VEMAGLAEDIGLESIWFVDHLLYRGEATQVRQQGVWECWSILAALAAVTSRVEIGSLVTPTTFRNPAIFAKQVDAVEEISGGRVILGLGAGWHNEEYQAFGVPFNMLMSEISVNGGYDVKVHSKRESSGIPAGFFHVGSTGPGCNRE